LGHAVVGGEEFFISDKQPLFNHPNLPLPSWSNAYPASCKRKSSRMLVGSSFAMTIFFALVNLPALIEWP